MSHPDYRGDIGRYRPLPWLTVASAATLLMMPVRSRAQEPEVKLGPGLMTFGQLAEKLSIPGSKVECLRALRDRAAFVYLKKRPWSQAVSILSAGLDLKIAEDQPKVWVMQRDPEVRHREQRWFDRWTSNMHAELREKLKPFAPYRGAAAFRKVKTQLDAWHLELRTLRDTDPKLESARAQELIRLIQPLHMLDEAGYWMTAELFRMGTASSQTVREAASRGAVIRAAPVATLFGDVSWLQDRRERKPVGPESDLALWSLELDSRDLNVKTRIFLVGPSGKVSEFYGARAQAQLGTVTDLFRPERSAGGPVRWPGLGADAVAWLDKERGATHLSLREEISTKSFTLRGDRRITSVSQVIEAWSRELDRETVMELWPVREDLHLPSILTRVELAPDKQTSLAALFSEPQTAETTPDKDGAHVWSLRREQEVLLVKNRLAFADRKREYPMAAFLALEKRVISGMYRDSHLVDTMGVEDIADYCKATTADQSGAWAQAGITGMYRGISTRNFARAHAGLALWEALPAAEQRDWLTRVKPRDLKVFTVPMSRFDDAVLTRFVSATRSYGTVCPAIWHPGFVQSLRSCELRIKLWPSYPTQDRADVLAWVAVPGGDQVEGLSAGVTGLPLPTAPAASPAPAAPTGR
jgi:hypothetical protein